VPGLGTLLPLLDVSGIFGYSVVFGSTAARRGPRV